MAIDHRAELRNIRTFPSLIKYLRDDMDWPIQTDDFENNHWLSAGRAGQVLDYFVNEVGIEQTRLGMAGYGENKPLGPNDTFEGRAQNRRVEIRVLYGDGPEEATPDSVKGLIEAASLQVQSAAAAQQEP